MATFLDAWSVAFCDTVLGEHGHGHYDQTMGHLVAMWELAKGAAQGAAEDPDRGQEDVEQQEGDETAPLPGGQPKQKRQNSRNGIACKTFRDLPPRRKHEIGGHEWDQDHMRVQRLSK